MDLNNFILIRSMVLGDGKRVGWRIERRIEWKLLLKMGIETGHILNVGQ